MFGIFPSKKTIARSGILQGSTDYHCHLLPGVDDGVKKPETTVKILKLMQENGVKEVWFTPHVMEEMPNRPDSLREQFQAFQSFIGGSQLSALSSSHLGEGGLSTGGSFPIGESGDRGYGGGLLHLAAEHMLDSDFSLERALQLSHRDNQLLVETSYFTPPYNLRQQLKAIQQAGVYPLLAHPCRYNYMSYKDYEELHAMGIHFQLNLPALTGQYGPDVEKKALWLLKHGYYQCTGTDTHSLASYVRFLDAKIPRKLIPLLESILES